MEENKKKRTQAGKLQKNGEIAAKRTLSKKSLATATDEKSPVSTSETTRGTASN
jgi:hypothetical protein